MSLFNDPPVSSKTLRVLARLIGYPSAELRANLAPLRDALHGERALSQQRLAELEALIDSLERGRATSLHLFEHVHGDSRDRGPAMIDLAQAYEKAGLFLADGELPDYLPVVLEFASTQPPREACAFLAEITHIFNALFAALQQRGSAYAAVFAALLELAGEKPQPVHLAVDEAIDATWEEPPVFDGCSSKGQAPPDQPQPITIVRSVRPDQGARA
jgi:nitrate reductase delta subunit